MLQRRSVTGAFHHWRAISQRRAASSAVSLATAVQHRLMKSHRQQLQRRVFTAWRQFACVTYPRTRQRLLLLSALLKRRQRVEMQGGLRLWREQTLLARYDEAVTQSEQQLDGLAVSWALQQSELLRFRRVYS